MSIEALLHRIAVALERCANNQEQLLPSGLTPPAEVVASPEAVPRIVAPLPDLGATGSALKDTATAWVGTTEDTAEKTRRAKWLQEMARALVGETDATKMLMLTGDKSPLTAEHRKKAVFFIKRAHKLKGTEHVDFAAPYDFDEAPDQGSAGDTRRL